MTDATNPVTPNAPIEQPSTPTTPDTDTSPNYDLQAATQELVAAYSQFLIKARDIQIGQVFKAEGFRLIDTGWLWIEKGITEGLRAKTQSTPANDNTAPPAENTPAAATQG